MASPIFNSIFSFNQTARAKDSSCKTDEGLPDCFDLSSAELTDVFEEESCENEIWTPPSKELRHQITTQLEHLLSDENLETDAFLLNHIHKDKLGYVSLKLLTSLKKIQNLTCDWRTVLAAAHNSMHLEVNEAGTKVKRKTPIPDWLYSFPNKQLLVWNFLNTPQVTEIKDHKTSGIEHEGIMDTIRFIFSSYGSIGSIHILCPEKEISTEFKCYMDRHPELGREMCAMVVYEYQEEACKAYKALRAEEQRHGGERICVALLRSQGTLKQENHEDESEEEEDEHDLISDWKNKKHFFLREDSLLYSSSESEFAPATPRPNRKVSRSQAQYGSPLAIPQVSSFSSDPYRNPLGSPVGNPLLPRRLFF